MVTGAGRDTWQAKALAIATIGSSPTVLSDDGRADLYPAWSPDGSTIAYTSGPAVNAGGEGGAQANLTGRRTWLMAPDGTSKRQLNPNATQREEHPLWSHDGHWLMVARPQASTASLWLTQADGSAERQVAANVTLPASFYGLIDWPAAYAWWQPANGASGA